MLAYIHKHFWIFYLLPLVLLGVALGYLAATGTDIYLTPSQTIAKAASAGSPPPTRRSSLKNFSIILERNIFDSRGRVTDFLPSAAAAESMGSKMSRSKLTLIGTMVAEPRSLALLTIDQNTALYRLDESLPSGGHIKEINRQRVLVAWPDGSEEELLAGGGDLPDRSPQTTKRTQGIKPLGENRWQISRTEAEQARANFNQLLKSARLEPVVVNGGTEGFAIKMIRPQSLLAKLGLRRGDVLKEVNGVSLDSPEKGLQIFQQLREAKNISIGLLRNGQPLTYEYELN